MLMLKCVLGFNRRLNPHLSSADVIIPMPGGGRGKNLSTSGGLRSPPQSPPACVWQVSHGPSYQEMNQLITSVCLLLNIWNSRRERVPVACQLKHLPWTLLATFISPDSHSLLLPRGHQLLPNFALAPTPPVQRGEPVLVLPC